MSITAVLNLFRRPYTLIQQLEAIQNQSIPPENIIIWKNYYEGIELPEIPTNLKKNLIIIDSSKNFGVWGRFTCGLLVNSKYICVLDDDTIPGKDWFKNCVETMKTHCGLLGTVGVKFAKGNIYRIDPPRHGWDTPNENTEQVDIVGHAWFFEQKWLHYLWECLPDYEYMHIAGEDIGFSYILQKHGINTYVPPHPYNNRDLWGSDPYYARKYGEDNVGVSSGACSKEHCQFYFDKALDKYIKLGFITMNNRV